VTTMEGLMEKEDATNPEFIVPAKLKELYEAKDYGQYADKDGKLIVCFLSNNDITGGNPGSPILNADGHLIGLAFDGNWEAMSGDIAFEPELQRTINVDARYVLFVMDKFAGAQRLIDELKIIK
ncbi:MAG: S46 family peptidase, partial [Bacteroidales bacterium]|nr:S46 family peptidase [Bacteroidales bacterium]